MSTDADIDTVLAGLRQMIAEEMHLLGGELQDALDQGQAAHLAHLGEALDEAVGLLQNHRAVRHDRHAD